jgi:ABC-type multidrug transport system ATPase subunit
MMTLELNMPVKLKNESFEVKKRYIYERAKSVNLDKKLGEVIGSLSKGYRQRVGLAATLLSEPRLLILDEPTEGLDPNEREEIRDLIKRLAKGRMILISTHVLQEVSAVCSSAIVIASGKVVKVIQESQEKKSKNNKTTNKKVDKKSQPSGWTAQMDKELEAAFKAIK